jgi:hypothetical protein
LGGVDVVILVLGYRLYHIESSVYLARPDIFHYIGNFRKSAEQQLVLPVWTVLASGPVELFLYEDLRSEPVVWSRLFKGTYGNRALHRPGKGKSAILIKLISRGAARRRFLVLTLAVAANFVGLASDGHTQTETTGPDTTQPFPDRVRYRSTAETIAALPGEIVYLPIGLTGYALRQGASLLYEKRVLRRLKGYLTFMDGRVGVRPLASSSLGSGGRVFFKDLLGEGDADFTSTIGASASQRRHHLLTFKWPNGLTFAAQFLRDPKRDFNGIGTASRAADKTSFKQEDTSVQLGYGWSLGKRFKLDTQLQYRMTKIGAGTSSSAPNLVQSPLATRLTGLDSDRARTVVVDLALRYANVDVPGSPTAGNRTLVRLGYNQAVDGDDISYLSAALVSEQFFELFYRRLLSVRAGTDWRHAPGDNKIPFYDLTALGGVESLRGYRYGRFRDKGVVFGALTYRFPIWRIVEGTLFYEVGRTLHAPDDLSLDDWQDTQGGSLRLWLPKALVGELLLARSSEQRRLLFNFKTDF